MGGIGYFFLEDWATVTEFKHLTGIKTIIAEPNGTKVSRLFVNHCGMIAFIRRIILF